MATSNSRGRRARLRLRTLARGWPRYYETARVHVGEVLLRAIPNTAAYFQVNMGDWKVDPYAFQPHKIRDVDGMSFFREDFVTPKEVAQANKHPDGARVARVTAGQLEELGLQAEVSPDPAQLPGHVIVPGMKFIERRLQSQEARQKIADLSQRLARTATKNGVYDVLKLATLAPHKQ